MRTPEITYRRGTLQPTAPSSNVLQAEMVNRPKQLNLALDRVSAGKKKTNPHSKKASYAGKQASAGRTLEPAQQARNRGSFMTARISD